MWKTSTEAFMISKMMKKMQGMAKFASKGGFKMPFMNK
jgi:hypothetical protein